MEEEEGVCFHLLILFDEFEANNIDKALSDLTKKGKIRRVIRGVNDYPKYSDLLKQQLSSDPEQVAYALSRKFKWRIEPSGETALNLLGLSTQVSGRYLYLSDGPNRSYKVGQTDLEFKKTVLKEIGFKYPQSGLIVSALKSLGKEHITVEVISALKKQVQPKMHSKILTDTKTVSGWVYDAIKQICDEDA